MAEARVAFLGDIVGAPGRRAAAHAASVLRSRGVDLIIANGENARHGSGLSLENHRRLRAAGIDAITLGDHCYRDRTILPALADDNEPVARPANLSPEAPGKRLIRLDLRGTPLLVLCVLGQKYLDASADSPFGAIDATLSAHAEDGAIVLVDIHAEATSEKQAVAWHCARRWGDRTATPVVAALGTHTHVQTNDARLLDGRLAAMTDVGMCGGHGGVIGRTPSSALDAMGAHKPVVLEIADEDTRARGCLVTLDTAARRAVAVEPIDIPLAQ